MAATLVGAALAVVAVAGLHFKSLHRNGVQAAVVVSVLLVCAFRLLFWAVQPRVSRVTTTALAMPINVGALGALADFAERTVPLLFAVTLLLVVYQWADSMLAYFVRPDSDSAVVAKRLAVVRVVLLVAALALIVPCE